METSPETLPLSEEIRSEIVKAIDGLDKTFKSAGIDYFIIGSIARKSYMQEEVTDISPEIDLLIPNKEQSEL